MDLAYTQLSILDRTGARVSAREAWSEGARSARIAAIYAAATLPTPLLALLHKLKRLGR